MSLPSITTLSLSPCPQRPFSHDTTAMTPSCVLAVPVPLKCTLPRSRFGRFRHFLAVFPNNFFVLFFVFLFVPPSRFVLRYRCCCRDRRKRDGGRGILIFVPPFSLRPPRFFPLPSRAPHFFPVLVRTTGRSGRSPLSVVRN